MQNKPITIGPIALTTTLTTNLVNCAITSLAGPVGFSASQPYLLIKKIRIVSKAAGATTFSLFLGASAGNAAGTEVFGNVQSIAARATLEYNGQLRMDSTQFLVGGASANTSLVMILEGEIGFS